MIKINIFRVSELLLGLIFLCAGLNGYIVLFGFNPLFPTSPKAMEFLGKGYLLALEKTPEIVCGILLIIRRFVPLALTILAPIIINILAFHIFVDNTLLPLAVLLFLLESVLIWRYRKSFLGLLATDKNS
ncbi:hypothetical protein ACFFF5_16115 [Lederbergia wuyishanensis]|uniref:Uncharacterized protein n=1 Tax=Lederbergia wuyishanensis TaxID=1347903 RepID=A0ABU0D5W8_9BACI|nr:hypothetical protein [Lederbergia wuyishanensis]MCJ8008370.1 hypothetical protein [Lederbergia wuyishanensis]MDQ0343784.1 hypothetical protein [Lederbergia wuyishanensis]